MSVCQCQFSGFSKTAFLKLARNTQTVTEPCQKNKKNATQLDSNQTDKVYTPGTTHTHTHFSLSDAQKKSEVAETSGNLQHTILGVHVMLCTSPKPSLDNIN